MELKDFIEKQMRDHINYANSFKKAVSISTEYYHPTTGRRLGFNEMGALVDNDAEKRTKAILKRIQREQQ